jgi:hypothetical protein
MSFYFVIYAALLQILYCKKNTEYLGNLKGHFASLVFISKEGCWECYFRHIAQNCRNVSLVGPLYAERRKKFGSFSL